MKQQCGFVFTKKNDGKSEEEWASREPGVKFRVPTWGRYGCTTTYHHERLRRDTLHGHCTMCQNSSTACLKTYRSSWRLLWRSRYSYISAINNTPTYHCTEVQRYAEIQYIVKLKNAWHLMDQIASARLKAFAALKDEGKKRIDDLINRLDPSRPSVRSRCYKMHAPALRAGGLAA